uniref:Uncharacterized protein n=1 Tax=Setaria viridis TaxID=4556 RepID=A0A4U6V4I5_SETVI|nr:hypothetical protein SEVIR_4G143100v2 [Setaria viridis]
MPGRARSRREGREDGGRSCRRGGGSTCSSQTASPAATSASSCGTPTAWSPYSTPRARELRVGGVYTKPFSMLPLSAVEKPGNLLMQGLLDKLVPMLGEQLLRDYHSWVQQQPEASS